MSNEIVTTKRGAGQIVTFNRPAQGNAMTLEMANQLFNLLKTVTTDRAVRAVMLEGAGGTFMNGIEMAMYGGDMNVAMERANQMIQPYHAAVRELLAMDKPVLAVASGMTAGPGLSFMLASDLVIAGRSSMFNGKFSSYASTPDGGCSGLLTHKLGAARAAEILMLGEDITAERADRINLVNIVVDDASLKDEGLALLDRLANGPTRSYAGIKKLVAKAYEQSVTAQMSLEHTYWGASMRSFDFREAVKAHQGKRPAKFSGS